jgi:hypothetical protein
MASDEHYSGVGEGGGMNKAKTAHVLVSVAFGAFCIGAILANQLIDGKCHWLSLKLGIPALIISTALHFIIPK